MQAVSWGRVLQADTYPVEGPKTPTALPLERLGHQPRKPATPCFNANANPRHKITPPCGKTTTAPAIRLGGFFVGKERGTKQIGPGVATRMRIPAIGPDGRYLDTIKTLKIATLTSGFLRKPSVRGVPGQGVFVHA